MPKCLKGSALEKSLLASIDSAMGRDGSESAKRND